MRKAADGTGEAAVLVQSGNPLLAPDWSRDGRYLVYEEVDPETLADIRYIQLETGGSASEPVTFVATPAAERSPKLSPDGRFVAYLSNESGRYEVYVRPFPEGAGKSQVSVNGGSRLHWRSDGTELYYVEGTSLMLVTIQTDQGISMGQPQVLFESDALTSNPYASYDVSADGQRFVMISSVEGEDAPPPSIRVVQNWYEEFRDRER